MFGVQIKVNDEWEWLRPSFSVTPYRFDTEEAAQATKRMCYSDETSEDVVRVAAFPEGES